MTSLTLQNRVGKISISASWLELMPKIINDLKFSPTKVEHLFAEDVLVLVGYSPLFKKNPEGHMIPEYKIYSKTVQQTVYSLKKDKESETEGHPGSTGFAR